MLRMLIIGLALFSLGISANAQQRAAPAKPVICDPLNLLPGCKPAVDVTDGINLTQLWQKIITASINDLTYAKALSDAAATPGSKVRSQCWAALITANQQASGAGLKNADGTVMVKPDPHLFTDVEQLGEVVDNLSSTGPLFTGCAAAAQAAKMNVLTFISTAVAGASGFTALGL